MTAAFSSLVAGIRSIVWRLVPTPQSITLSVVRGDGLQVDVAGVAAGSTRTWRDTIAAVEDGVLVVIAHATIEHGTLGKEPDTNVELTVSVDGARIGRSLVTLRQGAADAVNCTAAIRVARRRAAGERGAAPLRRGREGGRPLGRLAVRSRDDGHHRARSVAPAHRGQQAPAGSCSFRRGALTLRGSVDELSQTCCKGHLSPAQTRR